jgi:alpha-beta hydrolase superfamily lysophospholipase
VQAMKHLAKHRSKISLPLYAVHGTKDAVTSLDVSGGCQYVRLWMRRLAVCNTVAT